jgi:hypothetical protein
LYLKSYQRWRQEQRAHEAHDLARFQRIFDMPESSAQIAIARYRNTAIAAVIFCCYQRTAGALSAGTDFQYQDIRASNLVYAQIIKHLIERGIEEFHLGGQLGGPGLSQFKKSLGAEEYYSCRLIRYRFGWQKHLQRKKTMDLHLIAAGIQAQKNRHKQPNVNSASL